MYGNLLMSLAFTLPSMIGFVSLASFVVNGFDLTDLFVKHLQNALN